ncbi:hypothetical protein ILUMI_12099 [Ignelater luminosus]|uniref:Uncharacterized protein n=1 Tax=Ignelater luminosus TaxID=2038154 RepID=A0A8K0GDA4_IGNLU|nr:hypothetical protein ILUMI_12099 [Ignelater luminosus]
MVVSRRHRIMPCGGDLEKVTAFKYLGINVASDGKINHEINSQTAAGRMFHSVNSNFNSWALTSKHNSKPLAQEMRFLRRVVGRTRRDRIRKQTIRGSLNVNLVIDLVHSCPLPYLHAVQPVFTNEDMTIKELSE